MSPDGPAVRWGAVGCRVMGWGYTSGWAGTSAGITSTQSWEGTTCGMYYSGVAAFPRGSTPPLVLPAAGHVPCVSAASDGILGGGHPRRDIPGGREWTSWTGPGSRRRLWRFKYGEGSVEIPQTTMATLCCLVALQCHQKLHTSAPRRHRCFCLPRGRRWGPGQQESPAQ